MGSDLRFDYSVLGDTVNLASRLEGQSKTYGIKTILGDATAAAVKDSFAVIELDLLQVKGKREPEAVWTLLGDGRTLEQEDFKNLRSRHAEMLTRYRGRDFEGAEKFLDLCKSLGRCFGLDSFYDLYRDRIAVFKETPPPPDWTGVYTATSK
jgi:adenylate cyclase